MVLLQLAIEIVPCFNFSGARGQARPLLGSRGHPAPPLQSPGHFYSCPVVDSAPQNLSSFLVLENLPECVTLPPTMETTGEILLASSLWEVWPRNLSTPPGHLCTDICPSARECRPELLELLPHNHLQHLPTEPHPLGPRIQPTSLPSQLAPASAHPPSSTPGRPQSIQGLMGSRPGDSSFLFKSPC